MKRIIYLLFPIILFSCTAPSQVRNTKSSALDIRCSQYEINNEYNSDVNIEKIIKPYREDLKNQIGGVIGYSNENLTPPEEGKTEGLLGNYVTDIIRDYSNNVGGADICLMNNGGLRRDIPKGEITVGTMYELMPFDNELVICILSGKQIKKFAKELVRENGEPVSGIKITAVSGKITELKVNGKEVIDTKKYRVATSDYLAISGGKFDSIHNAQKIIRTSVFIRDILIDYYKSNKKIKTGIDGRIVIK